MTKRILLSVLLTTCLVLGLVEAAGAQAITYPDLAISCWEGKATARVVGHDGARTGDVVRFAAMVILAQGFDDSFIVYENEAILPGAVIMLWSGRNGPYDQAGNCTIPPDYMYALTGTLGPDSARRPAMNLLGFGGSVNWTEPAPELLAWGYVPFHGRLLWNRRVEDYATYRARFYASLIDPIRPHKSFSGRANLQRMYGEGEVGWLKWLDFFDEFFPPYFWENIFGQSEPPV